MAAPQIDRRNAKSSNRGDHAFAIDAGKDAVSSPALQPFRCRCIDLHFLMAH
jgi:hypothetical protein